MRQPAAWSASAVCRVLRQGLSLLLASMSLARVPCLIAVLEPWGIGVPSMKKVSGSAGFSVIGGSLVEEAADDGGDEDDGGEGEGETDLGGA